MNETQKLLEAIEAYLKRTGMSASMFGHYSVSDGKLVARMRDGGNVTLRKAEDIRTFMAGGPLAVAEAQRRLSEALKARMASKRQKKVAA